MINNRPSNLVRDITNSLMDFKKHYPHATSLVPEMHELCRAVTNCLLLKDRSEAALEKLFNDGLPSTLPVPSEATECRIPLLKLLSEEVESALDNIEAYDEYGCLVYDFVAVREHLSQEIIVLERIY
jgi:hypothetical protein